MPSYLKYRIKHTSEQTTSLYDYQALPPDILEQMTNSGVFEETDRNILPSTCTFITRVMYNDIYYYLCGIKIIAQRSDLIASDEREGDGKLLDKEGWNERRVSGALKTKGDNLFQSSEPNKFSYVENAYFKCKYCNMRTASATKHGITTDETIEFPICNCYTPRGGMAITVFDGAVQGNLATGYISNVQNPEEFTNTTQEWGEASSDLEKYMHNVNKPFVAYPNIPQPQSKQPEYPPSDKIGIIYVLLNARARVAPCCYYNSIPWQYTSRYFRLIDLAVAQHKVKCGKAVGTENKFEDFKPYPVSNKTGISDIGVYTYLDESDYYPDSDPDAYFKNILLGRNYDPSLPECGNNRRLIYTLHYAVTGKLTRDIREDDKGKCTDLPQDGIWHYDNNSTFSPRNCNHPSCSVKYQWGHLCNGGGSFDLALGKACPYYENPLMGDKDTNRYSKLQNMYAGDSVTGAAILELMWMCKGGLPWTQEEWETVWRVPYIWSTVPFSPIAYQTDLITDESGKKIKSNLWHTEYKQYAQRTSVDLVTGKIQVKPPVLLPGGTVTLRKRKDASSLEDGERIPDFPTIVRNIQMNATGTIRILWPNPDLKNSTFNVTSPQDYANQLLELKTKVYNKLIWSRDSLGTEVIAYANPFELESGIYCINTAFLVGAWAQKRYELEDALESNDLLTKRVQTILQDLWHDLIRSKIAGASSILDGMPLLKTSISSLGNIIFPQVPLSCLEDINHIIVFGFNKAGMISSYMVKVRPIFCHGYTYQAETSLCTSWKAVWNGRPSLFYNANRLKDINVTEEDGNKILKGSSIMIGNTMYNTSTGIKVDVSTLDYFIAEQQGKLVALINSVGSADSDSLRTSLNNQIISTNSYLTSLIEQRRKQLLDDSSIYTDPKTISEVITYLNERIRYLNNEISIIDRVLKTSLTEQSTLAYQTLKNDYDVERRALQQKVIQLAGSSGGTTTTTSSTPDTDNDEQDEAYDYRSVNRSYSAGKAGNVDILQDTRNYTAGDIDTDENGSITIDSTTELPSPYPSRYYVPYLNPDVTKHKDLDNYYKLLKTATKESITLNIPDNSGVAKWKVLEVSQKTDKILAGSYSFPCSGAKKVVVYSTRDSDNPNNSKGADQPKGVKLTEDLGKWYKTSSCNHMIILIMNPEIFNRHTERMIFSLSGQMSVWDKDASGNLVESKKLIKFVPINYTQVPRAFPGYNRSKDAAQIGFTTEDGVTYSKIQVSEGVEVLELDDNNRHPWVFFAYPVSEETYVQEWRFYDKAWSPVVPNQQLVIIPDKVELDLYIEFAYIAEIYDSFGSDQYKWENNECQTKILHDHPKSGVIRTVMDYTDANNKVDGFTKVPAGSHSMATLWPYARYACRDYEITYAWRDTYKGWELTVQNMLGEWSSSRQGYHNRTFSQPQTLTYYTQGDHDLGTEFQPKIAYKERAVREENMNVGIYDVKRSAYGESFETKTDKSITDKDPINSFPTGEGRVCAPPRSSQGAAYYPYTRCEEYSLYVPRHKTYIWDFLEKWRNKPEENEYLGGLRLRATDWCVKGGTVTRKRQWSKYWYYDPTKETSFLGRSKTRGPVFPLEYKEYYELPTKTVFLKPYSIRTGSESQDCYCPECNKYFVCADSPGQCPYCNSKSIERVTGWDAHWLTLLERVDSESTSYTPQSSEDTEASSVTVTVLKSSGLPNQYYQWRELVTRLFNAWKSNGTYSAQSFTDFEREQARGRTKGWYANIVGGKLEFVNDEGNYQSSAAASAGDASPRDMVTGCEKTDLGKRSDLGSFQISDGYIPGSVDFSSSTTSNELDTLESEVTIATEQVAAIEADLENFRSWRNTMTSSPHTLYEVGGVTYSLRVCSDPEYYKGEECIDTKISALESQLVEATNVMNKKEGILYDKYQNTAAGYIRKDIATKAAKARTQIEASCMRYYEYTQKSFGYNLPWSPYDSPPLFGNMGREFWGVDLCTLGSVISWLPRRATKIIQVNNWNGSSDNTKIPSWWTAGNPEGEPLELITLLNPPIECTRAISLMSSTAQNPFYNYVMYDKPFYETIPSPATSNETNIFENRYWVKDLRIVTKHDTGHYGEQGYRSDVGRFVIFGREGDHTRDFKVHGDSPSHYDYYENIFDTITGFSSGSSGSTETSVPPLYYIEGKDVKGFSVGHNETMSVGDYYPGYFSPINHSKFFTGFQSSPAGTNNIHWAWPVSNKDILRRSKRLVRWYADQITSNADNTDVKFEADYKEDEGINALSYLACAPYLKKRTTTGEDDGREISGGPKLKEDTNSRTLYNNEVRHKNTYFAIVAESERVYGGVLRPPLIWVEQIDNKNLTEIGHFKVPSSDSMPHRIKTDGTLQPVKLDEGDENFKNADGSPSYKTAFSTGSISDLSNNYVNPADGANLFTSKGVNSSGYFPGFIADYIDYSYIGKVYNEKRLYDLTTVSGNRWANTRLTKKISSFGQNNHEVTGTITIPRFEANASHIELKLNYGFEDGIISKLFTNYSDAITLQIRVYGSPVPGVNLTTGNFDKTLTKSIPLSNSDLTEDGSVIFDLDFLMTKSIAIECTFLVHMNVTDFYLGPWKGKETKIEVGKTVPDAGNYCYFKDLFDYVKLGILFPGKCAEVVEVEERGFVITTGGSCFHTTSTGKTKDPKEDTKTSTQYNFFTDSQSYWYKPNWSESYNRTDPKEGWWQNSGRSDDAWVTEGYKAMLASLQESDSNIGKVPKAEVFPKVCVEIPELCYSRLKMEAWENDIPSVEGKDWTWGGVWTTRMSGPEWTTNDQYPSRDKIWWPAIPYGEGHLTFKGRYFSFGQQYKDEARVRNNSNKRVIDTNDKYNEYAYKYELTAFDALLKSVEQIENLSAEQRRSLAYSRHYGGSVPNSIAPGQPYNSSISYSTTAGTTLGNFSGRSANDALQDVMKTSDWANNMANSATDAIYDTVNNARNYIVADRRQWRLLEEVAMDVDEVSWDLLRNREEIPQKEIFGLAESRNDMGGRIRMKSIVPYHDWDEIFEITGGKAKSSGMPSKGLEPITPEKLASINADAYMDWHDWNWTEIQSFSFREEENDKYPKKKGSSGKKWSTILIRKCGERWVHSKAGAVISGDCSSSDGSVGGQAPDCKDVKLKWDPPRASSSWPVWKSGVSTDGRTLKRSDPWWRF